MDDDSIDVSHQASFGTDGDVVVEGSTETSLDQFGADVDHRDRDSRLDRPAASEFGVDDRPEAATSSNGEGGDQLPLTYEDGGQRTLNGDTPTSPFETVSSDSEEVEATESD
jgi:hypothetical protein